MAYSDHMLLAYPAPSKHSFEQRSAYDFAVQRNTSIPSLLSTPPPERSTTISYFGTSLPQGGQVTVSKMTTPHRSLPPPGPLTYPEPARLSHPVSTPAQVQSQPSSNLPAPPPQWPGMEEAMRNWLLTKAEEEKRRQEEERTRQESLRLEQRKVEQNMLLEIMRHQIPPHLIPMIFLALGSAGASGAGSELLQQSISQLASQQSMHPPSPEASRDRHSGHQIGQSLPPTPLGGPYNTISGVRGGTSSGPPSAQRSHFSGVLPRLATAESAGATASASQQQEQAPILFHHWQPPDSSQTDSPSAAPQPVAPTSGEYSSSPKKRKAGGPHQRSPPPPSTLRFSETSSTRRLGHARHRSDVSSRSILNPKEETNSNTSRARADTAVTERSTISEQQWPIHRYQPSPKQTSGRLHQQDSFGETASHASHDDSRARRRLSNQTTGSGSAQRSPMPEERPKSREDVEMMERY